jgi:hypothetical protein
MISTSIQQIHLQRHGNTVCIPRGGSFFFTLMGKESDYRCLTCGDAPSGDAQTLSGTQKLPRQKTHLNQQKRTENIVGVVYTIWGTMGIPPWGLEVDWACLEQKSADDQQHHTVHMDAPHCEEEKILLCF